MLLKDIFFYFFKYVCFKETIDDDSLVQLLKK